jgi:ribosome-binding protein aMBF1 (putative translation factor)
VLSHQLGKRPKGAESISPPRDYPLPGLRPPAPTPHERLVTKRLERGWSRKVAARHLGIDVSTLRDWEQGKIILFRKHQRLVAKVLAMSEGELEDEISSRWKAAHRQTSAT